MNSIVDLSRIPDIQSRPDERRIAIQLVGVNDVRQPMALRMCGHVQPTIATWQVAVALPAERKGTHMSRFVAWLEDMDTPVDDASLVAALDVLLALMDAHEGRVEAAFPFFLRKVAPVSGVASRLDYQGRLIAQRKAGATSAWMEVAVPVKTLCPCSREISDYGAHNQRSRVTIRARVEAHVEWHELVRFAEDNASSEIWSLLKRVDEKWVTEHAYENPRFVEDLARDVALAVGADRRIGAWVVEVENFESIHNHSAWAHIEGGA